MTENFASLGVLPTDTTSLVGQLWYNKLTGSLFIKVTDTSLGLNNWRRISIINPTTPNDGDIRTTGTGPTFKIEIYGDGGWNQVFPAVYS